jgi:hypothetical protein
MALRKIKVMISSRCRDAFPAGGPPLSDTRMRLKTELEAAKLFGEQLYEVWINELAPASEGTQDTWDSCLKQVRECDIVLALSNGNAGWSTRGGDIGICHAELMTGLNVAAGKVRLLALGDVVIANSADGRRNRRFQDYVAVQNRFRGGTVTTVDELVERAKQTILEATADMVGWGVREARRGRFYTGEALSWSKLDYAARQTQIRATLVGGLVADGAEGLSDSLTRMELLGVPVLLCVHAIPAALSVSAAREMIGRPFLRDHDLEPQFGAAVGPVHVIGCHQTATETQARQFLGFPDATFVTAPFGIYAADEVQNVQFVFLQNCRDSNTTLFALQRLFEWFEQSGETHDVTVRAQSRRRIVAAVAAEAIRRGAAGA